MASAETIAVDVIYCPAPHVCDRVVLTLPAGSSVAQAVAASGLLQRHALALDALRLGVWTKPRAADWGLRDRDRVEIYRALQVDPKEARRQRYQQHKASQAAREGARPAAPPPSGTRST